MRRFLPLLMLLAACSPQAEDGIHGYLEADYVDLAAEVAGRLKTCADEGTWLAAGSAAFELDAAPESIELTQRQAEAAALQARRKEAEAGLKLARLERDRLQSLQQKHFVSREDLDRAEAAVEQAEAARKAADASLKAAEEGIRRLRWLIKQKRQVTSQPARVERCFFESGEWVAPGRPVVRLLPRGSIKAIVYVPEARLSSIAPGDTLKLHVDGRTEPIEARIRHIAAEPEFTPPVIYSEDTRASLVYRVEAEISPQQQRQLHPGQPVDAELP